MKKTIKPVSTSWEQVHKWYNTTVSTDGHYYHQRVIIPSVMRLMSFSKAKKHSLLDVGYGQGILARSLPEFVSYTGIDVSTSLVKEAKQTDSNSLHHYVVADATKPFPLKDQTFSHAAIILALQNMDKPEMVLQNISTHLEKNGKLLIVLNHPCFRIPRQSSWQIDQDKKIQYRRIDRYATAMQIPIQAHPSQKEKSAETLSFHHPLSDYFKWLYQAGFVVEQFEEWCSDKVSTGSAAKMENRSRQEFPLFCAIVAKKA